MLNTTERGSERVAYVYLINLLKRKTVLRITRAVRDSSCWDLDNVNPSSIWPSWCMMACNKNTNGEIHANAWWIFCSSQFYFSWCLNPGLSIIYQWFIAMISLIILCLKAYSWKVLTVIHPLFCLRSANIATENNGQNPYVANTV